MKTSVSLSVFPAPPGMPALFSGGTEQNISRIQELGYDGVDLFVKDPASADTRRTLALLRQYGLGIGAVMPAALAGEGLYLGAAEKKHPRGVCPPDRRNRTFCGRRRCHGFHWSGPRKQTARRSHGSL